MKNKIILVILIFLVIFLLSYIYFKSAKNEKKIEVIEEAPLENTYTSNIIENENSIYFSNNKGKFYSLDLETGAINWTQNLSSKLKSTVINNLIFSISPRFGSVIFTRKPFFFNSFATCLPVSRLITLSLDIPPEIINIFFLKLFQYFYLFF